MKLMNIDTYKVDALITPSNPKINVIIRNKIKKQITPNSYVFAKNEYGDFNLYYYSPMLLNPERIFILNDTFQFEVNAIANGVADSLKQNKYLDKKSNELLLKFMRSYNLNIGNGAGIGKFNVGKVVFSNDFAPCVAVIAKLKNGQKAIFHVENIVSFNENKRFFSILEKNAISVVVLRKNVSVKHKMSVPLISLIIKKKLPNVELQVVGIEEYSSVACLGNEIYISNNSYNKKDIKDGIKVSGKTKYKDSEYSFYAIESCLIEAINIDLTRHNKKSIFIKSKGGNSLICL